MWLIFWVVAGVTQAISNTAIHMLSISQRLTLAAQKPVFEPMTGEQHAHYFEGIIVPYLLE